MPRESIKILSPVGRVEVASHELAPRVESLDNLAVAFLDNRKPNANVLLRGVEAGLREIYPGMKAEWRQKVYPGLPAQPSAIDDLSRCQAAVVAVGD